MGLQHAFDFTWKDVFAAADKHVIGSADEIIETVGVATEDVTRDVVAVGCERPRQVGTVMISAHHRRRAKQQHALICLGASVVNKPQIDLRVLVTERQVWRRLTFGMGPEDNRATLRRPVRIQDFGFRESPLDFVEQSGTCRRRAHPQVLHGRKVGACHRLLVIEHHGNHRRNRGQPRAAETADCLDIRLHLELLHEDHARVSREHQMRQRKRVHVVKRCGDQHMLVFDALRTKPHLNHPALGIMREHDTFRPARRPRRIEKRRGFALLRLNSLKRSGFDEGAELLRIVELYRVHVTGNNGTTLGIAEHQTRPTILDYVLNEMARQAEIDRDGHQASAHDSKMNRQIVGVIRGKNGNAIASHEAAIDQCSCYPVCKRIERTICHFPAALAVEVYHRDLVLRTRGIDQGSQIS